MHYRNRKQLHQGVNFNAASVVVRSWTATASDLMLLQQNLMPSRIPIPECADLPIGERMRATSTELEYRSPHGMLFKLVLERTGEACLGLGVWEDPNHLWCEVPVEDAPDFLAALQAWLQAQCQPEIEAQDE